MARRSARRRRAARRWRSTIASWRRRRSAAQPDAARRHLETALEANRKCVRASLQLGDLEKSGGKPEKAIEHWKRIESQDPAYLALAAQRLARDPPRRPAAPTRACALLAGYLERYPSLDLLDTVFQLTLEAKGADEAYKLVRDELRRNPTLLGLDRLLEAQIVAAGSPGQRRDLELVRSLVHGHTRRLARYRCEACGFKARQFYWRCPACGGWETYPPRRTEEFELTRCTGRMNVTVIGTGYVGLVTGACLADAGNNGFLPGSE